jgi:hypothetical protein
LGVVEVLLVFSPKPCLDSLPNVLEGFLLIFALGNATGEGRALGHDPAFIIGL